MPTVSVVIINYNTRERTLECLRSLVSATRPWVETIVVDNGSTDGSAAAFSQEFPGVMVDEAGANLGFARGVNRGARSATGDLLLLLNPDTTMLPGSLEALVGFAVDHPEYGVYGGRTLRPDGTVDPSSCWGAPTLWSLACFASGISTFRPRSRVFDPESLGPWARDTVREVPIITGCLLLMRREDFWAIGGMNELYFLYGEDADFSLRATAAGHRPVVVPGAQIVHDVGVSTASHGRKMTMVMAGKTTLLRDHWAGPKASVGLALMVFGVGLRAALETVSRASRRSWTQVWSDRRAWLPGYPSAEQTIFGQTPPT